MRLAAYGAIAIIALWTVLAVAQLWIQPLSAELFIKLTITFVLVLAGLVIAALIHREYTNEKALKKDGFID